MNNKFSDLEKNFSLQVSLRKLKHTVNT